MLGYYSQTLFIDTQRVECAMLIVWNQVWFITLFACMVVLHVCVLEWINSRNWLRQVARVWNSVGVSLAFKCLCGCVFYAMAGCTSLLIFSFAHTHTHTHSSLELSLNTIHHHFLLLISSPKRCWIRVGFAGEHLLVASYAWIQESRSLTTISLLGFGNETHYKVSGPHRTNLTEEIGLLLLLASCLCVIFILG